MTNPRASSPFAIKNKELEAIKKESAAYMKKVNNLKVRYIAWFEKKHQSFVDSVKLIQLTLPQLVPKEINKLEDFRKIYNITKLLTRNGHRGESIADKMDIYLSFWDELSLLQPAEEALHEKLCKYCRSVTRLRQQKVKTHIDELHASLRLSFSESFNFTTVNNERENLYTYRTAPADYRYMGLVSFMPYLISYITKICYWTSKIYLEKE